MAGAIRETLYYTVGLVVLRAIGLVMLPVNTYFLSSAEYGRLEVMLSFIDVGALLFGLALPSALARFVGDAQTWEARKAVCAEYAGLALLVCGVLVALGAAFSHPIIGLLPEPVTRTEFLLLLGAICLEGVLGVGLTWMRIRGAARTFLIMSLSRAFAQAAVTATLLALGFGVEGVLIASASAALAQGAAMMVYLARDCGISLRFVRWREMIVYCGPLLLSALAAFVLGSYDRWVLAANVTPQDIALYGVAGRLGVLTAVLLQPFHMWWFPKRFMVLAEENGAERSADIVSLGYLIVLGAMAGVSLGGPFAVHVLTREAYWGASGFIAFIALNYAIQETGSLLEIGCFLRKDGFAPLIINLIGAGIAIALYYTLIPTYGVAGAIGATLVAQSIRVLITYAVSQHYAPIPYRFARLGLVTAITVVLTALATFALPPLVLPLAGVVILPLIGWMAVRFKLLPRIDPAELPEPIRRRLKLG
ncbi:lipopolysaccharide biosynthesis protein [Azorhizobium doebereinerae]|uniref:lipopolysaccharide biosynthesis protein n=1 Tax=Azorhizobium doebereinerae TaxID=281091 RepID=UPI000422D8F7|nr:lipopolysaccharide biosynthesis protein [Azorhizobium doebereinerae]